jgi:hypothetical protein
MTGDMVLRVSLPDLVRLGPDLRLRSPAVGTPSEGEGNPTFPARHSESSVTVPSTVMTP